MRRTRTTRASTAMYVGMALCVSLAACNRSEERASSSTNARPPKVATESTPSIDPPSDGAVATADLAHDERIAFLLERCAKNEPFLENTSDPIPVLVSKLAAGTIDPLRRARTELSEIGEPALPELRRLFDRSYGDAFLAQRLQNVIEVIGLMKSHAGRDVLLRGLEHPQEIVRQVSARALVNHPSAKDYDKIEAVLGLSSPDAQNDFALALLASDRARLERDFSGWIEKGEQSTLTKTLAPKLSDTTDPAILARWRVVCPKLEGEVRIAVQAALAKLPDESLLAEMRGWLKDKNPARRQLTAQALASVGFARELAAMSHDDPSDTLRARAVEALAASGDGAEIRALLSAATSDGVADVRNTALQALAARGDAAARDQALSMLHGSREDLAAAIRILRDPMSRDHDLASRAYTTLVGLHTGETQPVLVDAHSIERAIGQVPLEESARYLMNVAAHTRKSIQGIDAHRWYAQHAGNAGPAGRAWLRAQWASETDPTRRVDLVMAGCSERTPESFRFLCDVLDSELATPLEVLFIADRLARFGPSSEVAPALKRTTLRMNDAAVRPALNCILWNWYGLSK